MHLAKDRSKIMGGVNRERLSASSSSSSSSLSLSLSSPPNPCLKYTANTLAASRAYAGPTPGITAPVYSGCQTGSPKPVLALAAVKPVPVVGPYNTPHFPAGAYTQHESVTKLASHDEPAEPGCP